MSVNCVICDENVNKSRHALVCCPYCSFEACRTCCETFVLDKTVAQCMNTSCGKEWTRQQLTTAFTKSFINGKWKQNREKILFDREVALLPATQHLAEEANLEEDNKKLLNEISELNNLMGVVLYKRKNGLLHLPIIEVEVFDRQIKELEDTIATLYEKRNRLRAIYEETKTRIKTMRKAPTERKTFVRACPDEQCRGFLSSQWKCGLCEKYSCPDCHLVKGKHRDCDHTCNPDDVATAKLLASDTKPCPKCATGIFKIDGCDQMWCTQCKTAFSWRTGTIESRIHNPHYYEWLRRNNRGVAPRNPGDNGGCQGHMRDNIIGDVTYILAHRQHNISKKQKLMKDKFYIVVRNIIHLSEVEILRYRVDEAENNVTLRVKYMCNKITKEQFQKQVQQANKRYEKKREIYGVLQLLITTVTDILYRVKQNIIECDDDQYDEASKTLLELDTITDYTNECLTDISNTYNSKPNHIKLY
jgi:hypothetical protein